MGSAHPAMQRMQAELSSMRSRLAAETSRLGSAADTSVAASKNRERELQQALADQKARVLAADQAARRAERAAARRGHRAKGLRGRERQRRAIAAAEPCQPDQHDAPGVGCRAARSERAVPALWRWWWPPSAACCWPWPRCCCWNCSTAGPLGGRPLDGHPLADPGHRARRSLGRSCLLRLPASRRLALAPRRSLA